MDGEVGHTDTLFFHQQGTVSWTSSIQDSSLPASNPAHVSTKSLYGSHFSGCFLVEMFQIVMHFVYSGLLLREKDP